MKMILRTSPLLLGVLALLAHEHVHLAAPRMRLAFPSGGLCFERDSDIVRGSYFNGGLVEPFGREDFAIPGGRTADWQRYLPWVIAGGVLLWVILARK